MFKHVRDMIDYMPDCAIVEIFSTEVGENNIPFYNGNMYKIPKIVMNMTIKKFNVSTSDLLIYKIYV